MNRVATCLYLLAVMLLVNACGGSGGEWSQYRELSWRDLKPRDSKTLQQEASLDIIDERYSDYSAQLSGLVGGYPTPMVQQYSAGIVPEMDGQTIRIPGFIVPVEFGSENTVTEFFLVPYFGACFHNPPPPPNQTIYVVSAKPIRYESIYDPVWVMGIVNTKQTGNDIATAAYGIDFHELEPFEG